MKEEPKPNLQMQEGEQLRLNLVQPGVGASKEKEKDVLSKLGTKTNRKPNNQIDINDKLPQCAQELIKEGCRIENNNGRFYVYKGKKYIGKIDELGFHPKKVRAQTSKDSPLEEILYSEYLEEVHDACRKAFPSYTGNKTKGNVCEVGFTISLFELLDMRFIRQYGKRAQNLIYCIILQTSPMSIIKKLFITKPKLPNDYYTAFGLCDYYLTEKIHLGIQDLYLLMGDCYVMSNEEGTFLSISEEQYEFCRNFGIRTFDSFYN